MKDDLVWYVCYGSNLCFERFMCYLTGEGNAKYNISLDNDRKCINHNPPIDCRTVSIPYQLYFAKKSSKWDNKGICFIDTDTPSNTKGRAYLITEEQFNHVWKHEGMGWYANKVALDSIEGIPAYTFTGHIRYKPSINPSNLYCKVIIDGLIECGLSREQAESYIAERII